MYWIRVTNTDPSPRIAGQTYTLSAEELVPSLQPRVFLPVVLRDLSLL